MEELLIELEPDNYQTIVPQDLLEESPNKF